MKKIDICLLDCSAIQQYVFGSNKLKSNIGASDLVVRVYEEWLSDVITELFKNDKSKFCLDDWAKKEHYATIRMEKNDDLLMETGYIGGGNAVLLFRKSDRRNWAGEFVERWTRNLLVHAPGLRPVVAIVTGTLDDVPAIMAKAFEQLSENKNKFVAETTLPRHGITAECNITGLSAEIFNKFDDGKRFVSSVAFAKLANLGNATDRITVHYKNAIGNDAFGNDIEKLGQSPHVENHIAIVHIDGNNMGERFKKCEMLEQKRLLAIQVDEAVQKAMSVTLAKLVAKLPQLAKDNDIHLSKIRMKQDSKYIEKEVLPLRPIILNGDDITFVSDARLGLFLAETFIKALEKEKPATGLQEIDQPVYACAGVAITKTKYPFYRGYSLAEDLCKNAKAKSREKDGRSWLDFHISYRGLPNDLKALREQQYILGDDDLLLWRPWQISAGDKLDAFAELKAAIQHLTHNEGTQWPASKRKQLAQVLAQGSERTDEFLDAIKTRNLRLPRFAGLSIFQESGWQPAKAKIKGITKKVMKTPFFDVLESLEYYPECLLEKGEKNAA